MRALKLVALVATALFFTTAAQAATWYRITEGHWMAIFDHYGPTEYHVLLKPDGEADQYVKRRCGDSKDHYEVTFYPADEDHNWAYVTDCTGEPIKFRQPVTYWIQKVGGFPTEVLLAVGAKK